jgi:BarA-like signal transduction histidine kinase
MTRSEEWVVVYVAPNRPVAEMIQSLLSQEGLEVMVRSPGLSPFIGVDLMVEILVASARREKALEVLRAYSEGLPEGSPETSPDDRGGESGDTSE